MSSTGPENTGGTTKPAWKRFEELVAEIQQKLAPGAKVTTNVRKKGRHSGIERQIDVLVEGQLGQYDLTIVIECKDYKEPVGIEKVEAFITKLKELDATKGAMVASNGFTAPAITVASSAGVETYGLLDAENPPPGKFLSIPMAVRDSSIAQFSISFEFSGLQDAIPIQDWRYTKVFRADGSFIDCIINLVIDRWEKGKVSMTPGFFQHQPISDEETWIKGVQQLCRVNLFANYSVIEKIRFGRVPIQEMKGLFDYQRETTATTGFTTGTIDTRAIESDWQEVDSLESLAIKPILLLGRQSIPRRVPVPPDL